MSKKNLNRRTFLKGTAAAAGALTLSAASARRVYGANERIGVAFVGVGGRCQAHLDIINKMAKANKGVAPVAVCDLWDGYEGKYKGGDGKERTYLQGLYPSAKKVGLNVDDKKHVVKDYRKILELPEVDVVVCATPDHWHAKICIDAAKAKKNVYCEKPMTKTIDEANAVVDAMKENNVVMTVGVQSMADPTWMKAHEQIVKGKIGHVAQAQTSYYRNSLVGQWRYYRLWKEMNPKTIDWDMFLGHKFEVVKGVPLGPTPKEMPFDRAIFGQWRCYWPFGGGMFTDLFVHQTTHLISAMGVRYPARVVGAGGLYLEYDERDVPDVATIVADYDEGCQLSVTATMISAYPVEEVIRGRLGAIKFVTGGFQVIKDNPAGGASIPARLEKSVEPSETVECPMPEGYARGEKDGWGNNNDTALLWTNFLECVRSKKRETLSTPELGAAAFTTVALGVNSYRTGKVMFWDKELRKGKDADDSWSKRLEARSKKHDKPSQVMGWNAGDTGSVLVPDEYQKLAGPWKGDKDPAETMTGGGQ
jgi:predicted dehydrogenase